ncbi:hypothetical protein E2I00_010962 [Balaenoptera physalus]|uniref:Transporter n=1 Tax=Balaenoptera physalus TaxID=9770 RepID=A0A643C3M2_BALPH|nr:hypothetical protein E2I00_010962 [Balaenoptera physalus]
MAAHRGDLSSAAGPERADAPREEPASPPPTTWARRSVFIVRKGALSFLSEWPRTVLYEQREDISETARRTRSGEAHQARPRLDGILSWEEEEKERSPSMAADDRKVAVPKDGPSVVSWVPEEGEKLDQEGKDQVKDRGQWSNKMEFVLSVAGEIIGLGNVWRFPYLCYKNGGGAFFFPYFIFFFTCGIPVFFLEVALGQYTSQGSVTAWRKICPLLQGIGLASVVIEAYLNVYYIIILSWALFYLFSSFTSELPWTACTHSWNTEGCVDFLNRSAASAAAPPVNFTSPVMEFWDSGIHELGALRWELALCLLLAWVVCYFCIWKGVKSTGKVVYFTATFPYLMLVILLIRGITLPGAYEGIIYYLKPDLLRLKDPQVWMDAGTQIFFSFAICQGCLTALGSYNKYHNNCYRDSIALCFLNSATSFVAGFVVFSILGFMSQEQGVPISEVAESGLEQGGAHTQSEVAATRQLPEGGMLDRQHSGGMYIFQLFDYYACSGTCLLFLSVFEVICIGWVYGADRFYDNMEDMFGYRPWPLVKISWLFLTPGLCLRLRQLVTPDPSLPQPKRCLCLDGGSSQDCGPSPTKAGLMAGEKETHL